MKKKNSFMKILSDIFNFRFKYYQNVMKTVKSLRAVVAGYIIFIWHKHLFKVMKLIFFSLIFNSIFRFHIWFNEAKKTKNLTTTRKTKHVTKKTDHNFSFYVNYETNCGFFLSFSSSFDAITWNKKTKNQIPVLFIQSTQWLHLFWMNNINSPLFSNQRYCCCVLVAFYPFVAFITFQS